MTRKEILAMKPGRKLNMAVASHVMEHQVTTDKMFGDMERPAGDLNSTWDTLLPYSEDMSAARLVTQKMVTLGHNNAVLWDRYGDGIYTQAEAICKRALLVVLGVLNEEEADKGSTTIEEGNRKELLDSIVECEFDMFERVRTSEPSLYQEQPEAFRATRATTHSVLSTETLQSYLKDLQQAKAEGRNLLTEKYARMDNRIPPLKTNPIIDDIVEIEARWMEELSQKYPQTFKSGPGFKVYLSCELETYSDKTLELYFGDVSRAKNEGRNFIEERYANMTK